MDRGESLQSGFVPFGQEAPERLRRGARTLAQAAPYTVRQRRLKMRVSESTNRYGGPPSQKITPSVLATLDARTLT